MNRSTAGTNCSLLMTQAQEVLKKCQRLGESFQILPVSKGHSLAALNQALVDESFPKEWGENYEEELASKAQSLPQVRWHYLGKLQSRKIPQLCELASCLHTVSRIKELEIMAVQKRVPEFFVQVNISSEAQKNGCDVAELPELLKKISELGLQEKFLGLMGMSAPLEDVGEIAVRSQFRSLRLLRDQLCPSKLLNMGMSGDFKIAIEEGSNLVRIGTAIFGERSSR